MIKSTGNWRKNRNRRCRDELPGFVMLRREMKPCLANREKMARKKFWKICSWLNDGFSIGFANSIVKCLPQNSC